MAVYDGVMSKTAVIFEMECYCIVNFILFIFFVFHNFKLVLLNEQCNAEEDCRSSDTNSYIDSAKHRYSEAANKLHSSFREEIDNALAAYIPCIPDNCTCHILTLKNDLKPFKEKGISKPMFDSIRDKGTKYQIISGILYRQSNCHFPARCSGIEHYLLQFAKKLPDMEMIINTRDWPQLNKNWGHSLGPVFSFSKTKDYWDIMYPAWSFWEGGPAIKLYPTGLGKWHQHRKSLTNAAEMWPWDKKLPKVFFRGSRTNDERDPIVLLSRSNPELVDAAYTKNQAWKSDADTLYASPAEEVSLEDHCKYKYLFNYRGVAASFRFKHLFLCKSLVFHVGDEWLEFFYPSLKPWVHYVPVSPNANQDDLKVMIDFFREHDDIANAIAERGFEHIWNNLKVSDVKCYWKKLLKYYGKLLKYDVVKDEELIEIKPK